jgi:hypothetical protein
MPPSIRTAGVPGPARKKNALCAVGEGTCLAHCPKVPDDQNRASPWLKGHGNEADFLGI